MFCKFWVCRFWVFHKQTLFQNVDTFQMWLPRTGSTGSIGPATGGEPFRRLVWGWNREHANFTLDSVYDYGHDPSCELKPKVCSAFNGASQEWSYQVPVPPPPSPPPHWPPCMIVTGGGGNPRPRLDFPQCSACAHIDHPYVCVVLLVLFVFCFCVFCFGVVF